MAKKADLGGGVRDARPPPGRPNSFDLHEETNCSATIYHIMNDTE